MHAQQHEAARLVLGDAIRAADPRDGHDVAAIERLAAGDDVARRNHHAARVLDLAARRRCARARRRKGRECARHRDHDRLHDAGHRLVVEHRDAAHLLAARLRPHVEFLQVLQAGDDEEIVADHAVVGLAPRGLLLHALEHRRQRRAGLGDAEALDRVFAARGRPARAADDLARLRHELRRHADAGAARAVVDHAPADRLLLRFRGSGERCALGLVEHAGLLGPAALLERLDGSDRAVAELAVDEAVVVAGPHEIALDRQALGKRNGVVGFDDRVGLGRGFLGSRGRRAALLLGLRGRRVLFGGLGLLCLRRSLAAAGLPLSFGSACLAGCAAASVTTNKDDRTAPASLMANPVLSSA